MPAHAAAVTGIEPHALRFTGLEPISPARARYWNATVAHIRDDVLSNPEVAAEPLVAAEAFRALASAMLTTFPHTALAALDVRPAPGSDHAGAAALRRARAFIDDNAHRPIGLADIAAAARAGPGALQDLFRRHLDRTPQEQLRHVRLARAHTDLQIANRTHGDPIAAVAAVAARWGFAAPSRFAVQYRQAFGCAPTDTPTSNGFPAPAPSENGSQAGPKTEDVARRRGPSGGRRRGRSRSDRAGGPASGRSSAIA